MDRDSPEYKSRFFRSPGHQPAPALLAIVVCTLWLIFNGWDTFYEIGTHQISTGNAVMGLLRAYFGPLLFVTLFFAYKLRTGSTRVAYPLMARHFNPPEPGLDDKLEEPKSRVMRVLQAIR